MVERERLNWWLTLSANFAVLIGIALIIVELSQNRDSMRAQTRNELKAAVLCGCSNLATFDPIPKSSLVIANPSL